MPRDDPFNSAESEYDFGLTPRSGPPIDVAQFTTGTYTIKKTNRVMSDLSRRKHILTRLQPGTQVQVVEVKQTKSDGRIRGRIAEPVGWISLADPGRQIIWAEKEARITVTGWFGSSVTGAETAPKSQKSPRQPGNWPFAGLQATKSESIFLGTTLKTNKATNVYASVKDIGTVDTIKENTSLTATGRPELHAASRQILVPIAPNGAVEMGAVDITGQGHQVEGPHDAPEGGCDSEANKECASTCADVLGADDRYSRRGSDYPYSGSARGSQKMLQSNRMAPPPLPLTKLPKVRPPSFRTLCFAPLALFLISSLAITFCLRILWVPVVCSAAGLAVALHLSLPAERGPESNAADDWAPLANCILGLIAGCAVGIYAHEQFVWPYYAVALGGVHQNVIASSPAAAYADAGKIFFASSSNVAPAMSVGYRDVHDYCVAPVIDADAGSGRKIGFWAVGVDCCAERGEFLCGGAGDVDSRGGARLAPDGLISRHTSDFMRAVKQAAAVNSVEVADEPILLHWVKDPKSFAKANLLSAFGAIILGALLLVILNVLLFAVLMAHDSGGRPVPVSLI